MSESADVLFREEQQFRQPWLWALMLPVSGLTIGLFAYGMIQQLIFGKPWGDKPMPDGALLVTGTGMILLQAALLGMLAGAKLITEVRPDGLYVRFFPFHRDFRRIGWEELVSATTVTYRPIADYGGWGIRCGARGMAYNVSGNRGVLLELANGKSLLIGSQRPEELAEAIALQVRLPGAARQRG